MGGVGFLVVIGDLLLVFKICLSIKYVFKI